MNSRTEIRFNFQQALAQADKLDAVADRLKRVAEVTLENAMQTLSSGWKGENATIFLRKEGILKSDIKHNADEIAKIADEIRRIAKIVYNAEMEALRIADERRS